MPAGDRTGPWGLGPRTGRGLGYCSGSPYPGFMIPGPRFGFGRGFGRGMGLGRGRGFRRQWFGQFWGYPYLPFSPYQYPPGADPFYGSPPFYGYPSRPPYPGRKSSSSPEKKG